VPDPAPDLRPDAPLDGGRKIDLLPRLAAFARLLHDAGMEAGPRRLTDATRALGYVDLKRYVDFRNALRAVFVSRKEDIPTFEAAFDIFWAPPDPRAAAGVMPGRTRSLPLSPERAKAWSSALDGLPLPLSAIEVDWLPVPGARLLADIWVHAP